jgi:hypothetical protein
VDRPVTLTWWRSWPHPDELRARGRAHVVDDMPRLIMRDGDYSTVEGGLPDATPGFCLLEWDVALGARGRARFEQVALEDPGRVLVAPYDIYPDGADPTCVHKVCPDPSKPGIRGPAVPGAVGVHSFGFGCIYLPALVVAAWPAGKVMRDSTFSDWHIARHGAARVTWDVAPQHIHGD